MGKEEVTPAAKPDDNLTPDEEARFTKYLNKFLDDDEPDVPAPKASAAPANPGTVTPPVDVAAEVKKALEVRDKETAQGAEVGKLHERLSKLEAPKSRKWYEPWTLFS